MRFARLAPILAAALALGQPALAPDGGAGVVIRSTTALVGVRVVADDSRGKPVTDLEKKDFRVLDDGKPQTIAIFAADRAAPASRLGTPAAATRCWSSTG